MALRQLVEGESDWDIEGIEPADLAFVESFDEPDRSKEESQAWDRLVDADWLFEKGYHEVLLNFENSMENIARRIQRSADERIKNMRCSMDPHKRRLLIALVFKRCGLPQALLKSVELFLTPTPMLPPAIEASIDSYISEIRVHFLPAEKEGFHYGSEGSPTVRGLVLRYSDGVVTKTGDLRGTFCPGPIILMLGEHIVGVKERREYGEEITGLSFYAQDKNEINRHFRVSGENYTFSQEFDSSPPASSSVITEDGMIVHTLTWCPLKNCIDGHTTRARPQCPNPRETIEPEAGRVAGFSHYPYYTRTNSSLRTGLETDYPWKSCVGGIAYMWKNHVPEHVARDIENVLHGLSTASKYSSLSDAVFKRATEVLDRSNEVHNICTLVKMIAKSKDHAIKEKCRRDLKRQYNALTYRSNQICSQMKRSMKEGKWDVQYETSLEKDKRKIASLEMSNKLSEVLHKHNLAHEKSLLVCAWCPGTRIFDPRHIPHWQRCSQHGCASNDLPCCGNTCGPFHVGFCQKCHDPVCAYHLIDTNTHEKECEKTLSHKCGWRGFDKDGKSKSLDVSFCGKVIGTSSIDGVDKRRRCANSDCGVLCCIDCSVVCEGWNRKCTSSSLSECEGKEVSCKSSSGHLDCPDKTVFCKKCAGKSTIMEKLQCD